MTTDIPPLPSREDRDWLPWARALDAAVRDLVTAGPAPAGSGGLTATTDPDDPDVVLLSGMAVSIDPTDPDVVLIGT